MNELDTVNMMLRLIGSSPVNSLVSKHPDMVNAKTTLNRIRAANQQTGWWFNTEYDVTMTLDERSNIVVDNNVHVIIPYDNSIVQRGNRMYNVVTNTYTFSNNIVVRKIIRVLEWLELPTSMQMYCAYNAASQFIRDELEDPSKEKQLQLEAARAFVEVQKQHLNIRQLNVFDRPRVRRARGGVRPYGQTTRLFSGSPDV